MSRLAVLIDDDSLVRLVWQLSAERAGVKLHCFASAADLEGPEFQALPKATPIYLDLILGAGERGTDLAKKLKDQGYGPLFLTTAAPAWTLECPPWIEAVQGKSPPWDLGSPPA